jgi:hypothetical protein
MLDETVLGGKKWRGHVPMTATVAKKGFWVGIKQWLRWHCSGPRSWGLGGGLEILPLKRNLGMFALFKTQDSGAH